MDNEVNATPDVPYVAHESAMARLERVIKRLWVIVIILIGLLLVTNGGWLLYESQFEETVVTQDVDTGEAAAYVAGIGDVYNGACETDSADANA